MFEGVTYMSKLAISEAKNKFTMLRKEALKGKEIILADAKSKDEAPVSLISTTLLDELCSEKRFTCEWVDTPGKDSDDYSLWCPEVNVFGLGKTKEEAITDLISNIQEYALVYFNDLPYYLSASNPNKKHYWYLRRIMRANPEELRQVLELEEIC